MSMHVSNFVSSDAVKDAEVLQMQALAAKYEIHEEFSLKKYYQPAGPISQEFILDFGHITTAIMGPVGAGKTTACVMKRILAACRAPVAWHPSDNVPTRMCRWIVLRDSFRSAEKTVLESWKQWFPKGYPGSRWVGGNDRPVTHTLRFLENGIRVEIVTEFAGLNDIDIETLMKGREYSGGWLNEFDTHSEGALADIETRVGRYPSSDILLTVAELEALERKLGRSIASARRLKVVLCDLNAPTIDNHAYKTLVVNINKTPGRKFYRQPGGRDINAENMFKLEKDYYSTIIANNEDHVIRRLVDNEFGFSRAGKPVFESFEYTRHVARGLIGFDDKLDLIIGVDMSMNSLNPAATFSQVKAGRLVFIDELYLGHGVGAARFAEGLKMLLDTRYATARNIRIYIDPAAEYGADKEGGQLTAMETLARILGLPVLIPAGGSNELGLRLDAIKNELRGYLEPHSHMIICPVRCPLLIEGFNGKYHFVKKKAGDGKQYEEIPNKSHPHSDILDSAQYNALGIRGRQGALLGTAGKLPEATQSGKFSTQRAGNSNTPAKPRGGFDPHRVGSR